MSGARGAANLNIRESQYLRRFVEIERYSEKTLDVSSLGSILRDFEMSRPYPPESRAFESLIFRRFRNMPPGASLSSSLNISSEMPVEMVFQILVSTSRREGTKTREIETMMLLTNDSDCDARRGS